MQEYGRFGRIEGRLYGGGIRGRVDLQQGFCEGTVEGPFACCSVQLSNFVLLMHRRCKGVCEKIFGSIDVCRMKLRSKGGVLVSSRCGSKDLTEALCRYTAEN